MGLATTEITNMQNQTAYMKNSTEKNKTAAEATSVSNMFLTLMLQQLQNQDPTQPTDNTEWLAQLAQYSSLEQMAQMNTNLSNCMGYMATLNSNIATNAEITQTLSLIGKEVTVTDPDDKEKRITGKVTEASFEDGTGKVKINDTYYSIANIVNVKDTSLN